MKYLVAIVICGLLIGGSLSIAVYYLLGSDAGFFVAKFIAPPVSIVSGIACFLVYDHWFPKNKSGLN